MKILVEAMAADFGGIRTYADNLLVAWRRTFPADELVVVTPDDADLPTHGHRRHGVRVPRPSMVGRPWAQSSSVRRFAREERFDAVLATMPVTSLVRTGVPTAVVVHDLRHEVRPEQFGRGRRFVRKISYGRSYQVADGFIAVSQRTLDDLHRLHPRTREKHATVVHHGADHVLAWAGTPASGPAITFAHHTNKNPELVLEGWAAGVSRGFAMPDLLVLGTGTAREHLRARVAELGLEAVVELAPFLADEEFATVMRNASMVVFPSDFEGFGLPVVEGMLNGVPVVIGPEAATLEVAGGYASVLADWTPGALAEAVDRAGRFGAEHLGHAREHASGFTWERCAQETRAFLELLAERSG